MSRTAIAVTTSLAALLLAACAGVPPRPAGSTFAPCGGTFNCVSSQDPESGHRVEAITYTGTRAGAQQLMASILRRGENMRIVTQDDGYLHATYTAPSGLVNDIEMIFPADKRIEVRSASRTGMFDFGANRARIETLRKSFNGLQP